MQSKPIAKLIEIQTRVGLTDKEMAGSLGCSRQLWQMTRSGKIPLGNTMTKCISKNFPELHQDIIYFLAQSADKSSRAGDKNPLKPLSEPQGRGLKKFCVELLGRMIDKVETFIERH